MCARTSLFTVLDDNPVNEKCAGFHSRRCGGSQHAPVGGEVGPALVRQRYRRRNDKEKNPCRNHPKCFPAQERGRGRAMNLLQVTL